MSLTNGHNSATILHSNRTLNPQTSQIPSEFPLEFERNPKPERRRTPHGETDLNTCNTIRETGGTVCRWVNTTLETHQFRKRSTPSNDVGSNEGGPQGEDRDRGWRIRRWPRARFAGGRTTSPRYRRSTGPSWTRGATAARPCAPPAPRARASGATVSWRPTIPRR